ncbi:MAG TPA: GAF domain-containing protein [Thermoleophilia bacterium]|nr:GAF domain-containing protein [Thermoleophilia bacterium]
MTSVSERPEPVWLRVGEVASALGVSANTVRRWTDVGRIAAHRSPGGHRRYLAEDVRALLPEGAPDGGAQPGDFAELRRQSQTLRSVLQVGLELVALLADDPHDVPAQAARALCELTGAPRCDVYLGDGETVRLVVSAEAGELQTGREGSAWTTREWAPVEGDLAVAEVLCVRASDRGLTRRARLAMQRRGCRSLAWAPMALHGALVGALELSDAGERDFSRHADALQGLARICAEAVAIQRTMDKLARRDKAVRELVDLSHEVAQTHDFERFVLRFAQRLLTAANADCVDVWRAGGGVIRSVVSYTREGEDPGARDTILDTSSYPSLERTLLDHTPLAICDLRDPRLGQTEAELMRGWGFASSLTMPLVAGGELVGLVDLYDDAERDWSADLASLTSVCQLVAGVFDSTALLDEARETVRLREELVELGADLAAAEEAADVAERAARRLRDATGCEDCDIWWLEEGYLRCLASVDGRGVDETVLGKQLILEHYPSAQQAIADRQILVISSLDDDRLTDFEREDFSEYSFRSTVSVPLVTNDQVVGMIDLFDVRERDYNEVRGFLPEAARTVADALRNAELLAGLRRGNAALRELVELGDRLNEAGTLEDLARAVAERLRGVLAAEDCDIWQVDDGVLRCLASVDSHGWDADEVGSERELATYEATVAALTRNEPIVVGDLEATDLSETEMQAYRRWGFRSMVSLPLVVEGRPIGLIDVFDTKVRDYTVHLDLIRNVGRLLAGSFEKAMLVERLEGGNQDLRLLVDSGMEFAATLDVDAVLRTVAERILAVSEADMCDVYRLDGDEFEILVAIGGEYDDDPAGSRYLLHDCSTLLKAAEQRRPVRCTDIMTDPTVTAAELEDARIWGYRESLDVPLTSRGEVIGFISLMNRETRGFPREEVVVGLAQVASQAIANAGLYRQLDDNLRRMALVSESALELTGSLDLQATLLTTARRLCVGIGVGECEIAVIEGNDLRTLMRVDGGEIDESWMGQRLPLADAAVTREVIATKRPAVVGSLRDPRLTPAVRELNSDHELMSWATLPLIVKDRVIGTVELVESGAERSFTKAELDTAAAICHAAALAIDNAALFAREKQTARATQLLNDIAARTAASLDLEEVVKAAVDELGQLMTLADYTLLLLEGDTVGRVISSRPQAEGLAGLTVEDFGAGVVASIAAQAVRVLRLPGDLPALEGSPAFAGVAAVTAIALPSDTGLLGVLGLESLDPDAFTSVDRHLLERVGTQLSLAIKNAQLYDEIKQMHLGNLKALSSALNAKDYYTLGHAARVAAYTVMLGRELGWPEDVLAPLEEAAYLHDIGKISISDRVLLKPGRLNQQEWDQMRQHPTVSADIIRPLFPKDLVLAVRHHHERYDGGGYPDGLSGEDIPALARAMAVVDAYDAMSCRRPYKAALTYAECLAELHRCRGTQFDPAMVDAFLTVLEEVAGRRAKADEIAATAAARIRGETHRALLETDDEQSGAYKEVETILREVRDANPPTRFLTTHAQVDKRYVIGVDPEEDESEKSHLGDEIFVDDELTQVLAGKRPHVNTVFADEFGVWITGLAPIRDVSGDIVAVAVADLPALSPSESEALRGDGRQTFAAMLQSAAVRLSRAEIDAITDALTGLYNHRYLHERLSEELHRARDQQRPLSVLFCDLDHFKRYNDASGHSAGDAVLREVAHVIEQSVRNVDIAARYGGEEFVVLLVETHRETALVVAERIRERIRAAGFTAGNVPLTVSIGVAGYPDDADRREDLLNKADWAMYLAKRRGRDQVAIFGDR